MRAVGRKLAEGAGGTEGQLESWSIEVIDPNPTPADPPLLWVTPKEASLITREYYQYQLNVMITPTNLHLNLTDCLMKTMSLAKPSRAKKKMKDIIFLMYSLC